MTDDELVLRARQGDSQAWDCVVRKYQNLVFARCRQFAGSPEAAEDLAQDVWTKAYTHLDGFRGESSLSTWLWTIASGRGIDLARRARRAREWQEGRGREVAVGEYEDIFMRVEPGPDAHLERKDIDGGKVWDALGHLAALHREILVLRLLDEWSFKEIATLLDLSPQGAFSRFHRAHLRFIAEYGPEAAPGPDYPDQRNTPIALPRTDEGEFQDKAARRRQQARLAAMLAAIGEQHVLMPDVLAAVRKRCNDRCVEAVVMLVSGKNKTDIAKSFSISKSSGTKRLWDPILDALLLEKDLWKSLEENSGDFQDSDASNVAGEDDEEED